MKAILTRSPFLTVMADGEKEKLFPVIVNVLRAAGAVEVGTGVEVGVGVAGGMRVGVGVEIKAEAGLELGVERGVGVFWSGVAVGIRGVGLGDGVLEVCLDADEGRGIEVYLVKSSAPPSTATTATMTSVMAVLFIAYDLR